MKNFKNDEEKRDFLIVVVARYRIFLMKWLNVDKTTLKEIISRRMNIDVENCSLKSLDLEQTITMIKELKQFKYELTGSKRLPDKVNPRAYAIKVKNKRKEELNYGK